MCDLISMHTDIHTCIQTCIQTCIHAYRHTYMHTLTRTGKYIYIFPCSADHELDWQSYPVDPYYCYMCDDIYIHPCIQHKDTLYTYTQLYIYIRRYFQHALFIPIVGVVKRGVKYALAHRDLPRQHSFRTYLGFTDPVPVDSTAVVDANGMQLRGPINPGLAWRMAVLKNKWALPRKSGGIP